MADHAHVATQSYKGAMNKRGRARWLVLAAAGSVLASSIAAAPAVAADTGQDATDGAAADSTKAVAAKESLVQAQKRYQKALKADKKAAKQLKNLQAMAKQARKKQGQARRTMGNMAREAYTAGNTDLQFFAGLVDSESADQLVGRAETAGRLADGKAEEFNQAREDSREADRLTKKAKELAEAKKQELDIARSEFEQSRKIAGEVMDGPDPSLLGDMNGGSGFIFPVPGFHTGSQAGMRKHPIFGDYRCHAGSDIEAPTGTPILAASGGVVEQAGVAGGYGNYVQLNHGNSITTGYGHMSQIMVSTNENVKRGQVIGRVGSTGWSTGAHLHWELRVGASPVNPDSWVGRKVGSTAPVC